MINKTSITALILATIALSAWLYVEHISLGEVGHCSGWTLFGVCIFLMLYNIRKKFTHPPLLRSHTWLKLHIFFGFMSVAAFMWHTSLQVPQGAFECILWLLYVAVAGSGVVGLIYTRTIPGRLTVRGEEVIFERIPIFRRQVGEEAKALVLQSVEEHKTHTLSSFYTHHLADYFSRPQNRLSHFVHSKRHLHDLLNNFRALYRYLNDGEKEIALKLENLIERKDALDFHHCKQSQLKYWLFVHIPLTYGLILFAVVHVVLIELFYGVV